MKILDLYIGRNFLKFFAVIILIPGVLFSVFQLLSELDVVGRGTYGMTDALFFIILTAPGRFLDLVPITALLAGIAGLGRMADRCELVAMEAVGISKFRISLSVLAAAGVVMAAAAIAAEFVVPPLEQDARLMRAQAISVRGVTFTQKGFWARRGDSFVHVSRLIGKDAAEGIDIFSFDRNGNLESFVHAGNAVITEKDHWILHDVTRKIVKGMAVETESIDHVDLESFLSQDQVSALELPPETLSTPDLMDYIQALEKSGQNADHYRLALWRKLSQPLATGAMVILALSFVFGSTRRKSAGLRITMGSFVGIALYFFDQITMHAGLLLGLSPAVVAFIPFEVISLAAFLRLRQVT